jgi:RNA polymerase sigma-70 factor, ECF subfamily
MDRTALAATSQAMSDTPDFATVFEHEFDYVWFTLRRLGVRDGDLEDVTHDVFIRVHAHLDQYDADRPLPVRRRQRVRSGRILRWT